MILFHKNNFTWYFIFRYTQKSVDERSSRCLIFVLKFFIFFLAPLGVLTRACGLDKEGFAEHTKRSPAKGLKHGLGKARDLKKVAFMFRTEKNKKLFFSLQ